MTYRSGVVSAAIGACAAVCLWPATPALEASETAAFRGTVSIASSVASKKRVSRRSLYRKRQSSRRGKSRRQARSPFADVVVIARPLSFEPPVPQMVVRMDQVDATFTPRVLPLTVGSTVEFVNQDKVYHNVFSLTSGADFNIGRKARGVVESQVIDVAGEIDVFCDIHPQMNATILSLETPYFTTLDSAGAFAFEELPDGTYEIEVFHPQFESKVQQVELEAGAVVVRDYALSR